MLSEILWFLLGMALLQDVLGGTSFAGLPLWASVLLSATFLAPLILKILGAHILAARLGPSRWVALGLCFCATALGAPSPGAMLSVACGVIGIGLALNGLRLWLTIKPSVRVD